MAEILPVTTMIAPAYEPMRQNRWVVDFDGIDAWTLKTFAQPSLNHNEIVIDYINTKRYFQGKFEWQPISFTLYNPITPSAAQKMMDWVRLGYENISGRAGYKEFYVARNFQLKLLDPIGSVVSSWLFENLFLTAVNFNTLDYSSGDAILTEITARFDAAILSY